MDPGDTAALLTFYNGLARVGNLSWSSTSSLCYEKEVGCINGRLVDL